MELPHIWNWIPVSWRIQMENAGNSKLLGFAVEIRIQGKEETFMLRSLNPPDISPGWRPTEEIKILWIYLNWIIMFYFIKDKNILFSVKIFWQLKEVIE